MNKNNIIATPRLYSAKGHNSPIGSVSKGRLKVSNLSFSALQFSYSVCHEKRGHNSILRNQNLYVAFLSKTEGSALLGYYVFLG